MRARALLALLVLAVSAAPASAGDEEADPSITDGSAQHALDAARARWRKAGPANYTYRTRLFCFCTTDSLKPHTFVVRNRKPRHRPPKGLKGLATGWRLFKLVQDAIDEKVDGLSVRYRKNGLLKELDVDQFKPAADDEYSYSVDRFSSP
jgi:hypothetical protein